MTVIQRPWWKDGTVYQIYPASYKDSNGDGWGDLPGIISKIPYLKELGVDIVWISPMYESPQFDMGYDISNYEEVHPPYGTVEDMESLVQACHSRGMRLILDLVINHTSHEHQWFKDARSSKDHPRRNWYIWRPARYDADGRRMPPNNWRSNFHGSAWEWDKATQEYYLHLFAPEQPDLNWENEETRNAIYDSAMKFWLDKGVDGFRIDTVNMYSKCNDMPDAAIVEPHSFEQPAAHLFCNGPRIHEFLREMNEKVLNHYDAMTVGELPHTPDPAHVLRYVGSGEKQLNMVFQFDIVDLGIGKVNKYDYDGYTLPDLKAVVTQWQTFIAGTDGWTTAFCENHDQGRAVSRYGCDLPQYRVTSAKMLSIMMATLTGTLFIYQGQEIGMINAPKDWPIEVYQDIESINYYKTVAARTDSNPKALAKVMKGVQTVGRDNARVPMHWDSTPNAGFTDPDVKPWMRIHDAYPEINVKDQQQRPESVLNFWKKMLQLRKTYRDIFIHGSFEVFEPEDDKTFIYVKEFRGQKAIVALNFTSEPQAMRLPEVEGKLKLLVSNMEGSELETLQAWEGRIYLLE